MRREYRTIRSEHLGRPLEMLVYGDKGKPLVVFPSQQGRFFDYENFGMIDCIAKFIEDGKIHVYCIDGIDHETWFSDADPAFRLKRAREYDLCITQSLVPHIHEDGHEGAGIMLHGCSFGAFHTANEYLKNPKYFDSAIAISGCYNVEFTMPDFSNQDLYFNNPIMYVPGLEGNDFAKKFKENLLILCSGQGAWEEWIGEAEDIARGLKKADIPVILDLWGHDVNHDWPWWKKMIVYFLEKFDKVGCLKSNHRMNRKQVKKFLNDFHSI